MPVEERSAGDTLSGQPFVYPYRLRRGACSQYIALELLKVNGFDEDVINEALRIKRSLSAPQTTAAVATSSSQKLREGGNENSGPEKNNGENIQSTPHGN